MAIVIELDEPLRAGDAEEERRTDHQQPDPQIAREQWDYDPIANIGDQLALPPPRTTRIAGPEERQDREHDAESDRHRHELEDGHADAVDERDEFLEHENDPDAGARRVPVPDIVVG